MWKSSSQKEILTSHPMVANAKAKDCDVFYSPVSIEAAALIIDQAEAQKLDMPILAGDTWDSNVVLEAAKG